jgi:hypothetical protein
MLQSLFLATFLEGNKFCIDEKGFPSTVDNNEKDFC